MKGKKCMVEVLPLVALSFLKALQIILCIWQVTILNFHKKNMYVVSFSKSFLYTIAQISIQEQFAIGLYFE